jgi:hypothetical protein
MAPHLIEPASSARSKCRGCGDRIESGSLRFGETVPNPFAEGETTHWFHLECAAFKRPQAFLDAVEARTESLEDGERLLSEARRGVASDRLPQIHGAERSRSSRAQCRSCRAAIAKDAWRIALVTYEEGRFLPAGFIHAACCQAYFETTDVLARVKRFSPNLSEADLRDLEAAVQRDSP